MGDAEKRQANLAKQMAVFADYIKRAVWVDTLAITADTPGVLRVEATWDGGAKHYVKDYNLSELPRLCRTRRAIISDLLEAREPLKD